jgi:G:T-mismatch repair DNA endonuclease (very short patch repair protein)
MPTGIYIHKKQSKETKEKMSKIRKRMYKEKAIKPYWLGKKQSEETKIKRKIYIGHLHSRESKKKISEANKGKNCSEKTKRILSERNNGKKQSEETKIKISLFRKGKKHSDETKRKISLANSKIAKEKWKNKDFREKQLEVMFKGLNIKPNKPEQFLIELLEKNNLPFPYVGNGQITVGGKCPDFICNPSKKVVLLHGYYWHYLRPKKLNPLLTIEQVEENDKKHYKKYFFDCLIIWDYELKNPNKVVNKIQSFIK